MADLNTSIVLGTGAGEVEGEVREIIIQLDVTFRHNFSLIGEGSRVLKKFVENSRTF